jgi:hypothetical protein
VIGGVKEGLGPEREALSRPRYRAALLRTPHTLTIVALVAPAQWEPGGASTSGREPWRSHGGTALDAARSYHQEGFYLATN